MLDATGFPFKRAFLYAIIGSVCVVAILGIGVILSGRFGWEEARILLTTVTVAVGSLCGLACGAYLLSKPDRAIPVVGLLFALAATIMIVTGMWNEVRSDAYWRFAAGASVFAIACAHLAFLSLLRLAKGFQWSLAAARGAIFGVALLIMLMLVFEPRNEGIFRLLGFALGVAIVCDAAITILIPVFHRLSAPESRPNSDASSTAVPFDIDAEIAKLQDRLAELEQMKRQASR